jgi:hypothetical protein
MKNLKKSMALVAAIAMSASMLAGCTTTQDPAADTTAAGETVAATTPKAAETQPPVVEAVSTGKELVYYAWNEELKGFIEKYYLVDSPLPADVTWSPLITTGTNEYIAKTDAQLAADATSAAADKIDLFAAENNYIKRYIDVPYTMPLTSLGLTQAELDTQVPYTLAYGIDASGVYKAISFQTTPMLMVYRKSIAEKVLGTSDPAAVGEAMKDWAAFDATAQKMKDAGVYMVSGYGDTLYAYTNSSTSPIVAGGSTQINVPAKWNEWVDAAKTRIDNGYTRATGLWAGDWTAGMSDGTVFAYSGPAWFINFSMNDATTGTDAYGDYLATTGPVGTFWGGTWMLAGASSDNTDLVADIMRYMCIDTDSVVKVASSESYTPSSIAAFEALAAGGDAYGVGILGGQNPFAAYLEAAESIDPALIISNASVYGSLVETYSEKMGEYLNGTVDKETALQNFYTQAQTLYPELTF